MGRKGPRRLRTLIAELTRTHPELQHPAAEIAAGRIAVDGQVLRNPSSLIRAGASIVFESRDPLRGEAKLVAGLAAFDVSAATKVALDVGAAAGGFTRVLLAAGAERVYAVDAGHGQLLGSLRQETRVVNLKATNLGALDTRLVPDTIELFTIDISYLSLAAAAPQLDRVRIADRARLIALVKPTVRARARRAAPGGLRASGGGSSCAGRLRSCRLVRDRVRRVAGPGRARLGRVPAARSAGRRCRFALR